MDYINFLNENLMRYFIAIFIFVSSLVYANESNGLVSPNHFSNVGRHHTARSECSMLSVAL